MSIRRESGQHSPQNPKPLDAVERRLARLEQMAFEIPFRHRSACAVVSEQHAMVPTEWRSVLSD